MCLQRERDERMGGWVDGWLGGGAASRSGEASQRGPGLASSRRNGRRGPVIARAHLCGPGLSCQVAVGAICVAVDHIRHGAPRRARVLLQRRQGTAGAAGKGCVQRGARPWPAAGGRRPRAARPRCAAALSTLRSPLAGALCHGAPPHACKYDARLTCISSDCASSPGKLPQLNSSAFAPLTVLNWRTRPRWQTS